MKLYTDCDYFGDKRDDIHAPKSGECEECYRYAICIHAFFRNLKPIPIEKLPEYIGKKVFVCTPNIERLGREAVVEDVNVEKCILWLVDDFTCHQYGEVWEAYPFGGPLPEGYGSGDV